MTGGDVDAAAGLVQPNRVRDDWRRRVTVGQPRLEPVAGNNLGATCGKFSRQKPGVVPDNQPFRRPGRRIFDECLCDGVGGDFDVRKRERVTDNPAPTRCSKFDDRHAGIITFHADASTGMQTAGNYCKFTAILRPQSHCPDMALAENYHLGQQSAQRAAGAALPDDQTAHED